MPNPEMQTASRTAYNETMLLLEQAEAEKQNILNDIENIKAQKKIVDDLNNENKILKSIMTDYINNKDKIKEELEFDKKHLKEEIENFGNLFESPRFNAVEEFDFKEKELLYENFDDKKNLELYFGEIQNLLKDNVKNSPAAEKDNAEKAQKYFEFTADENFLDLEKHSGDKHNLRKVIRDKYFNKDGIPKNFTSLGRLFTQNPNEYKNAIDKLINSITDESYKTYIETFDRYITAPKEVKDSKKTSIEIINNVIKNENSNREFYNDTLKGGIPSVDTLLKLKEKEPAYYNLCQQPINDVIGRYNIEMTKIAEAANSISNTSPEPRAFDFDSLDDYFSKKAETQRMKSELGLDNHNKKDPNNIIRGQIKGFINTYNQNNKKLPNSFSALTTLYSKDKIEYENAISVIRSLIDENTRQDENTRLKEYLNKFDVVVKSEARSIEDGKAIDELIAGKNKENLAQTIKLREESKNKTQFTTVNEYQKYIENRDKEIYSEFEKGMKKAESKKKKAEIKLKILNTGGEFLDGLTDKVKEAAIAMSLGRIKGELKSVQDEIDILKNKIKENESAATANRLRAGDNLNTASQNANNLPIAGLAVKASAEQKSSSQKQINTVRELKAELEAKQAEYDEKLKQSKAAVKEKLLEFFNADKSVSNEKDRVDIKAKNTYEKDIEDAVNPTLDNLSQLAAQADKNLQARKNMEEEAAQKSKARKDNKIKETAINWSDKIDVIFSEKNMGRIDSAANIIGKVVNFVSDSGSNDEFNINNTLQSVTDSINELNNPDENAKEERTVDKIIELSKSLCQLIENTNQTVKNMIDEAKTDYELTNADYENYKTEKKRIDELLNDQSEAEITDENGKVIDKQKVGKWKGATSVYATAKYTLNSYSRMIDQDEKNLKRIKKMIEEIEKRIDKRIEKVQKAEKAIKLENELADKLSEKEKAMEELQELAHRTRLNLMAENKNEANVPFEITEEALADKETDGIGMISKLSGTDLGQNPSEKDLKDALNKIYINGMNASMFFNIDNMPEKGDPAAMKEKFDQIGNAFKEYFEETIGIEKPSNDKKQHNEFKDRLNGQIIAVESQNFLLKPVVLDLELNSKALKDCPKKPVMPEELKREVKQPKEPEIVQGLFKGKINRENKAKYEREMAEFERYSEVKRAYETELRNYNKYRKENKIISFNEKSVEMCKNFNNTRLEAAKSNFDAAQQEKMNENDKNGDIRQINLSEVVKFSRNTSIKSAPAPTKPAPQADKAKEEKTTEIKEPSLNAH